MYYPLWWMILLMDLVCRVYDAYNKEGRRRTRRAAAQVGDDSNASIDLTQLLARLERERKAERKKSGSTEPVGSFW